MLESTADSFALRETLDPGVISRDTCPLCNSAARSRHRVVDRAGAAHELKRCSDCGFVYAATARLDTADHGELSKLHWRFRSRHFQIRRLIHLHLAPGSRIVEIGCGRGELGFIIKDDNYAYTGYEPASGLAEFGRRNGINIVHDFFRPETVGAVDAIVIDNVLEHVLNPRQLLADAVSTLNHGGIAIVIVPNRNDVRQLVPHWRKERHWIPPDHINYFSSHDLRGMFASCGLRAKPFGFRALTAGDYRYFPRAILETVNIALLGHNIYAIKNDPKGATLTK